MIYQKIKILKFLNLCLIFLFFQNHLYSFIDYYYTSNIIILRTPLPPIFEKNQDYIRSSLSVKNIWSLQYERFLIDGEEYEFKNTFNKKINNCLVGGFEISYKLLTGGNFDNAIEAFHRMTNVRQQHRERFPKNKFNITYEPYGKIYEFYNESDLIRDLRRIYPRTYPRVPYDPPKFHTLSLEYLPNGSYFYFGSLLLPLEFIPRKIDQYDGIDNPKFYIQYLLFHSSKTKINTGLKLKIPIVNKTNYLYSYGTDISIFLSLSYLLNDKYEVLYGISYTHFDLRKYTIIQMNDHQWVSRLQLNYFIKNYKLFIEYSFFSRAILNMDRLGEDSHFLTAGIDIKKESYLLSFAMIENIYLYGTSPDIGLQFSITFH